ARLIAEALVLAIRQRHRGRHGDRVAGVDAHRIDVLDRADDDEVVVLVADDLELVLLPAEDALLDEDLVRRRLAERPLHLALELARVLDDGAALPTEREARAQDHGITGVLDDLARLFDGARVAGARALEPDARHRLLEEEAILRLAE